MFKTIQIPRLIRGKPGAWDPLICLDWGHKFLIFLKDMIRKEPLRPEKDVPIWRVTFKPRTGVSVGKLEEGDVRDVIGGEDRVGFLPTWYWNEVHATTMTREAEDRHAKASEAPPPYAGWQI
jgi:RAT1-interacting protein